MFVVHLFFLSIFPLVYTFIHLSCSYCPAVHFFPHSCLLIDLSVWCDHLAVHHPLTHHPHMFVRLSTIHTFVQLFPFSVDSFVNQRHCTMVFNWRDVLMENIEAIKIFENLSLPWHWQPPYSVKFSWSFYKNVISIQSHVHSTYSSYWSLRSYYQRKPSIESLWKCLVFLQTEQIG